MRKFLIFIGVLCCLTGGTTGLYYLLRQVPEPEETMDQSKGTAIVITGASARIPQETALLEQLYYLGELNAILVRKYTWTQYRNLLFPMTNQSVFYPTGQSLFPLAFPPVRISKNSTLPPGRFIDGGTTADYIPYRAVLEFEKFSRNNINRMIIVSRKLDTEEGLRGELLNMGINRIDLVDKLGIALEDLAQRSFFRGLESLIKEAPVLSEKTFIYLPAIPREYPLFDFSNLKDQCVASRDWAGTHKPIALNVFLKVGVGTSTENP